MAFSVVQSEAFTANDVGLLDCALSSNPVAGNALIALVTLRRDLVANPSVVSVAYQAGSGNAWAKVSAGSDTGDSRSVEVWYSQNVGGGPTTARFTFDNNPDRYAHIVLVELSGLGVGAISTVGNVNGQADAAATHPHGSITTDTGVESIIFTVWVNTNTFTISADIPSHTTLQTTSRAHTTYRIVSGATTTNPTFMTNELVNTNAGVAAFSVPATIPLLTWLPQVRGGGSRVVIVPSGQM